MALGLDLVRQPESTASACRPARELVLPDLARLVACIAWPLGQPWVLTATWLKTAAFHHEAGVEDLSTFEPDR